MQWPEVPRAVLSLVDHDELGYPVSLHPKFGNLPLHPDQDGWYSVLGSWNDAADNTNSTNWIGEGSLEQNDTIRPPAINPPRNGHSSPPKIYCQYHKCSGNRFAIPFIQPYIPTYCITLTCTNNPRSGPHTCAPGRFTCEAPNCSWSEPFKTKQAFNRHYRAKHRNDRVDCPVAGCVRVGAHGIKRADNLAAHMLNKHGISHARLPAQN